MKLFKKNGTIQFSHKIVIVKDDMQIFNPTEEMILEDGWEEYVTEEYVPTTEEILKMEKTYKIEKILAHDSSSDVNEFTVNDIPIWLDKATRVGLKLRFETEIEDGETETTLWYNGVAFPLEINTAIKMLHAIEKYASKCYDNTQKHIGCVNQLDNIEDVQNYDYRVGYPEKLSF